MVHVWVEGGKLLACACVRREPCAGDIQTLLRRSEYVADGLLWGGRYDTAKPYQTSVSVNLQVHMHCTCWYLSQYMQWRDWTTVTLVTEIHEYCVTLDDAYTCHTAHVTNTFSIWPHTFSNQALCSLLPWWFVFVLTCLELLWLGLIKEGLIIKLSVTKQGSSVSDINCGAKPPILRPTRVQAPPAPGQTFMTLQH